MNRQRDSGFFLLGDLRFKLQGAGVPDAAVSVHVQRLVGAEESKPLFAFEEDVPGTM